MSFSPSSLHPDVELRDFLQGKISVGLVDGSTTPVAVFGDWERSTNEAPDDFIVVMNNGVYSGVGMRANYAEGFIMVSLYSRLNNDGSVKKNRVEKLLAQFDTLIEGLQTDNYFYKYDSQQFITPTTPNASSGYSITTLNITWHTTNNFNTE